MPPSNLFGLGYGVGPAGYGYPSAARPPAFSYAGSPFGWYSHVQIDTESVTSTGGPIASFAVLSGTLPAGISLNATTGDLTGTPTEEYASASVVIRASGAGGHYDATVTIEVLAMPLSLSSSLAAWYKADAGCYTDAACLFASASSQYLSKTSPTFAPTTKMTIAFDWKPTTVGANQDLVGRWASSENQFLLFMDTTGQLQVYIATSGTDSTTHASATTLFSAGSNYRIVVNYDGTRSAADRVQLYINGSLDTLSSITGTIPATLSASTRPLEVGTLVATGYANGAIARLGFSSLALSGAALTAAHTSTFWADMTAARQADWFSFYNLCEASSTRVDSTGLNNLTPTNGPTVAAGPGEGLAVNNSPVKRIEDQSGAGLHATQSTIAKQGLWIASAQNGRPGILLDGVNDYYDLPATSYGAFTKVFAVKWTRAEMLTERVSGAEFDYMYRTGYSWAVAYGANTSAYNDTDTGATWMDGTYVITHRFGGTHATHIARRNGAARTGTAIVSNNPGSAAVSFAGTLGGRAASLFCAGHFMEMVLANVALSDPQTVSAESYMNTRYAIY